MGGRETPEQRAKRDARYLKENRPKCRARWAVKYALKTGRLKKGRCWLAGPDCEGRIEAHHHDYDRPLDVTWMCAKHHRTEAKRVDYYRVRPVRIERTTYSPSSPPIPRFGASSHGLTRGNAALCPLETPEQTPETCKQDASGGSRA